MIGILDYGAGNMASVGFALERLGTTPVRVSSRSEAEDVDGLIFPGVGRARAAVDRLQTSGLWALLAEWDRPLLGICLGMQLLFERSEEDDCPGLGLLAGSVVRLGGPGLKVPHMGWNEVRAIGESFLGSPAEANHWYYFVHSFAALDSAATCGVTEYGGRFVSAIQRESLWGVQFHPERSGEAGAAILRRFVEHCAPGSTRPDRTLNAAAERPAAN